MPLNRDLTECLKVSTFEAASGKAPGADSPPTCSSSGVRRLFMPFLWPEQGIHNLRYAYGTDITGLVLTREQCAISPAFHPISYATAVFGGVPANRGVDGYYRVWQWKAHFSRLISHAVDMGIIEQSQLTVDRLRQAFIEVGGVNLQREMKDGQKDLFYFRPIIAPQETQLGVGFGKPFVLIILTRDRRAYYGDPEAGITLWHPGPMVCRVSERSGFPHVKSASNYAFAAVWKNRAREHKAQEVLLENLNGGIAEASGSNAFIVTQDGTLVTPSADCDILNGITRQWVIKIARARGMEVFEPEYLGPEFYSKASEAFLSGSWADLTAVRELLDGPSGSRVETPFSGKGMGTETREIRRILHALFKHDLDAVARLAPNLVVDEEDSYLKIPILYSYFNEYRK